MNPLCALAMLLYSKIQSESLYPLFRGKIEEENIRIMGLRELLII